MRRALYASTGAHAGIILWMAIGGIVRESDPVEFEVTAVNLISSAEFEAMVAQPSVPAALEVPEALQPTPEIETPVTPEAEAAPPEVTQPDPVPTPEAETTPEVTELVTPQAEVTDQVAALQTPPPGDPTAPLGETPTPRDVPRVAPTPAPTPAPEVETAPDVVDQPTEDAVSETPAEDVTPTAPEEATTEIVTEAEDPSAGSAAPLASVRPQSRPNRPQPIETSAETPAPAPAEDDDPLADAIAAAVADAANTPAPAASAGPPLTAGQRDGFRIAVQNCWNVGSLSSEALQITVTVGVEMARDGRPETGSIRLIEFTGGSSAAAQQAYEAARRAIIRCGTNGYDLPEDSYAHWQSVEMVFNPEGMRLR